MRVDKSNIEERNKRQAQRMLNQLRSGQRVFGNPAEGLRKSLKDLEERASKAKVDPLEFMTDDSDIKAERSKIKAGIDGEVGLATYLEKLIKLDESLDGLVVFASVSTEDNDESLEEKGYIPDSDFIVLCGRDMLILDAKNIRTHPENPIFISEGDIKSMNGVLIEKPLPSTHFWRSYMENRGIKVKSIDGYTVIYNNVGATILKNDLWYKSQTRPIHISDLKETLNSWMKGKDRTASLELITEISKCQIKKEKSNLDLSEAFRKFKL